MISSNVVRQSILAFIVSLGFFCIGLVRGYSAPGIPSIHELDPGLIPNKGTASIISAIPPFGAFFGSLLAVPTTHRFGRKFSVLLASPIWMTSWILIALSSSWGMILTGRILSGFSAGISLPAAQIYVSECSDSKIRGVLGSFPSISMSLGILVSYILGSVISWRYLAWFNFVISTVLFVSVFFMPESPIWLRSKKRNEEAQKSARWLKLAEFQELQPEVKDLAKKYKSYSIRAMCRRTVLIPLAIGLVLMMIQQLSGIDAVIFFTVDIFRAAGSSINSHLATIIVGAVQLLSNISSLFIVDRFGRKPLLIISGIVMCASMALMGVAFHLNSKGTSEYGFLPLGSLISFMVGYSFGFGSIPYLLLGELFPTKQRGILSAIAGSYNLLVMFIVVVTYHPLEEEITTAGTFYMYSGLCFLGVIFVIFFVPETKGMSLDSIAELFAKPRKPGVQFGSTNIEVAYSEGRYEQVAGEDDDDDKN